MSPLSHSSRISGDSARRFVSAIYQPTGAIVVSLWFGGLIGFVCLAVHGVAGYIMSVQRPLMLDARFCDGPMYLVPLFEIVVFGMLGTVLFTIAHIWRRMPWRLLWFLLAGYAASSLICYLSMIHLVAQLILAAGIAFQFARTVAAHPDRWYRFFLRSTAIMTIAAMVLAIWTPWVMKTKTVLPDAEPGAPNVLLITLDTVRAKNLGLHGYRLNTTPFLNRYARESVVFDNAIAPSPWTLPTHASLFTGLPTFEHGADWQRQLDDRHSTLAEEFSARGYRTAGFVANFLYCTRRTGLQRGMQHYDDLDAWPPLDYRSSLCRVGDTLHRILVKGFPRLRRYKPSMQYRKWAPQINQQFLNWLDASDQRRPFFAFLNYFDVHDPYKPQKPFDKAFPNEIGAQAIYDRNIAFIDHYLDKLFNELQQREILQNTLVIITSDHGEQFGEHGLLLHGNSLYRPLLHVPLLISYSGVPKNVRITQPVSLVDIPATIADVLEWSDSPFPGSSLAEFWATGNKTSAGPRLVLSELSTAVRKSRNTHQNAKGPMKSVVSGGLHYIKHLTDGWEQVYDWENDCGETTNLLDDPAHQEQIAQMRHYVDGIPAPNLDSKTKK